MGGEKEEEDDKEGHEKGEGDVKIKDEEGKEEWGRIRE